MTAPWTPGPWKQMSGPHPDAKDGLWVGPSVSNAVAFATAEADARLIAAAPEMAALLAEVTSLARKLAQGGGYVVLDRADSLLARVRGDA